ncbi:MAG TPA: YfhO family protein [Thermomicrobiales bacterium]|nr:YfhO family protein [Thermomicrobiales bacterium]
MAPVSRLRLNSRAGDWLAAGMLAVLTALVAWNRLTFDPWLGRFDLATFFLPWYAFLGERLRAFDVPGWNPHLFSGAPFAGDPESGWMYLPAMLFFPLLPVTAAFKAMVAFQLAVASLSTYAYARVLGMGPIAGLVAAVAYLCGPFVQWNTYCCLIFAQFGAWVPLALLGVELALRGRRWRDRIAPWFLTGFAISQMFAGWVGEGWFYAVLLPAAYTGYRTLVSPPHPGSGLWARLTTGAVTTLAGLGLGLALGAAGILPRIAANAQSHLAGGDYAELGAQGILNPPWRFEELLIQVLGTGYAQRRVALGGAVIVLALLAPVLARRLFAVPFFAGLTFVAMTLVLDTTPLHRLVYLIPRYQSLHEHDPWRTYALAAIGPAILAGAAVESLANWRGRRRFLAIVAMPFILMAIAVITLQQREELTIWPALLAAAMTTVLIAMAVTVRSGGYQRGLHRRIARLVPVLILAVVFIQPMGMELSGSWFGWPRDPSWERYWDPDPSVASALATEIAGSDPGGAGGFLQAELARSGPFRYVGYGGVGYPDDRSPQSSYMATRFQPNTQAILVNGRPIFLGLYEIQGYDPLQLARYAEFMEALNGRMLDYHVAYLLPSGVRSPLLDLLNVRYVLIDASLPPNRDDIVALTADRREVFRTEHVVVYESIAALPHAWIVHDARAIARGEALPLLIAGAVDPRRTALIEGTPPELSAPVDPSNEHAEVTSYEPDRVRITARAMAPGFLVVSEVYEPGWRAYVDGERVEVLPTDHVLRGVPIPAGEHIVELRYEPLSLRFGLPISAVTMLAMLVVFTTTAWRRIRGFGRSGNAEGREEGAGHTESNQ